LLQHDDLRTVIGNNGRRTVESRFDIKMHTEELISIYVSLINEKKE